MIGRLLTRSPFLLALNNETCLKQERITRGLTDLMASAGQPQQPFFAMLLGDATGLENASVRLLTVHEVVCAWQQRRSHRSESAC